MKGTHVQWTLALILALAMVSPASAETYVVDGVKGDDANDGVNAPFRTLARGAAVLRAGDTLSIVPMDEPYRESLRMSHHGTSQAPIIIEGNGAVLSGSDPAPKQGWSEAGGIYSIPVPGSTDRSWLFAPDRHFHKGASPTSLQPEQFRYADGKLYFRPAEGRTPADYDLLLGVRSSGVAFTGAGQIIVRNLTCMNFWNDGFNVHGGSGPCWFENIKGLWNGDEGFSCHENSECYVRGGEFSHNYWHGICDIQLSRTHFTNCVIRDNVSKGVYFLGGAHSLTDCEISGSPIAVLLSPTTDKSYPRLDKHPLAISFTNFRNCVIEAAPDAINVQIQAQARGVFEHCVIKGGRAAVLVEAGGLGLVANSIVFDGADAEVSAEGEYYGDYNIYHPGRLTVAGTTYGPDFFADYKQATGNDAHSFVEEPKFVAGTWFTSKASHGFGASHARHFGGPDIGLDPREHRPAEGADVAPAVAVALVGGGAKFTCDFETSNPWSRIYPEPVKNQAGVAVDGSAKLSDEQAHGGGKSVKLTVTAPAGQPGRYTIKFFSVKLPFDRPVVRWSFWMYGDGSGRRALLRVRDSSGECFYDKPFAVDWTGWRHIEWDLIQRPPATISAGDGNHRQNGPPMELVAEINMKAGETMTLYFDDLEVELAGGGTTSSAPTAPAAPPATPVTGGGPTSHEQAVNLPDPGAAPPAPAETTQLPNGRTRYTWDFESAHAWNRIYPVPETSQAGAFVQGQWTISAEQAHEGAKSGKIVVKLPAGPPGHYTIKLFSPKFRFDARIRAVRWWVHYSGPPIRCDLRVRDARGEGFYAEGFTLTGDGWQQIAWDLEQSPPVRHSGGNNDGIIDFPPQEVVMELKLSQTTHGAEVIIYLDDLQIETGD
ncbi:MAG: right-handed parallel beta-helix repeat-containing protein [Armatimonadetes bacterium]|nr:right-handed parallel beta-helix repeat-containing protein [Armatimonadota bacterium]